MNTVSSSPDLLSCRHATPTGATSGDSADLDTVDADRTGIPVAIQDRRSILCLAWSGVSA